MKVPVAVDCRTRFPLRFHFRLRRFGLRRSEDKKYRGVIPERKMERLREYCRQEQLKFYIDNEYGTRSSNYRACFFKSHAPVLGLFYFCAYCGRPVSKRRVTVDHLYPVAKVSRDLELQKKLRRQGITDLNSGKNLVPACCRCNQKKAAQMGSWIRRGRLGRHAWIWAVRWMLRIALIVFVLLAVNKLYPFMHINDRAETAQYTGCFMST